MIILMGVAGAGKSMQGRMLADEHGFAWISTGEMFRVLVTGQRRQEMLEGKLLSDKEVIELVDKTLSMIDLKQEFVLDGFPRTLAQAEWLLDQVHNGKVKISAVFNLKATREVVKNRLKKRGRQDDTETAIEKRFTEYESTTLPILDYFKAEGIPIQEIDADQKPDAVHGQIAGKLKI